MSHVLIKNDFKLGCKNKEFCGRLAVMFAENSHNFIRIIICKDKCYLKSFLVSPPNAFRVSLTPSKCSALIRIFDLRGGTRGNHSFSRISINSRSFKTKIFGNMTCSRILKCLSSETIYAALAAKAQSTNLSSSWSASIK